MVASGASLCDIRITASIGAIGIATLGKLRSGAAPAMPVVLLIIIVAVMLQKCHRTRGSRRIVSASRAQRQHFGLST